MNQEEIISNYIAKILNIHDEALTEEDLRGIALEQGLDEEAYQELQEVYAAHMLRGKAFMKHENWSEAIGEFDQALAINPLKVEGLLTQSNAYEERWKQVGEERYKEEAMFFARRALKFDPENLSAIEAIGRLQAKKVSKNRNARLWIFTLLVLLIGGLFITYRAFQEKTEAYGFKEPPTVEEKSTETVGNELFFSNYSVPIRFDREGAEELTLIPNMSELKSRKDDHPYHLQAWLSVLQGEISKIVLEVNFVLEDNATYLAKELTVFNRGSLPARTGDKIPFGNIIFQKIASPENLKEVYIRVLEISTVKAPEAYVSSVPLDVSWGKPAKAGVALETRLRTYEMKTEGLFPHVLISLEGKNTGKLPISVLEFQVEWLDAAGESVHKDHQFLVSSYSPALLPGETYVSSRTYGLNKVDWQKIDSYRVSILRAW